MKLYNLTNTVIISEYSHESDGNEYQVSKTFFDFSSYKIIKRLYHDKLKLFHTKK